MASVTSATRQCARCLRCHHVRHAIAGPSRYTTSGSSGRSEAPQRPRVVTTVRPPSARYFTTGFALRKANERPTEAPAKKGKINMDDFPPERIRNLSIIAHIDHGKSTLADRLLQMTDTVPASASPQFLDKLKVERERGITVKAQTVSIIHTHTDGHRYLINLIDTPGHVDFSYEVSRSLGACEGGLILVDSTQGIQAQTLSVFHVALEADLKLLPVINKVDLPHAMPEETSDQIATTLGLPVEDHMQISAKSGLGVDKVLNQIIDGLPPPRTGTEEDGRLRALVFDTHYDHFRGVVSLVRVFSGSVRKGDKVRFLQADRKYEVLDVGIYNPEEVSTDVLHEGQVGYLIVSMKNSDDAFIGDTVCLEGKPVEPLPGFKPMKAMVYAGAFPADTADFNKLEEAIERLTINDRSVSVQRETSAALSQGFRLGFLGTLHMDVFRQRLEDEYASNIIITAPTVPYKVTFLNGRQAMISNPAEFPEATDPKNRVASVEEPMVHATIFVPNEYIGSMMDLSSKYRGVQLEYKVLDTTGRAMLRYSFPLSEIVSDFFSELKSASSGFASFDYEEAGYESSNLVKLNMMLNGKPVDALAMIVHRDKAPAIGKMWCKKLKDVIPKQLFELAIQATIGNKVIARESLSPMRKDVTAGLYGGHYERKMKHLNKQKEGKKRLKKLAGNIEVPQSAFFDVLSSRPRSFSTSARQQAEAVEFVDPILPLLPPQFPGSTSLEASLDAQPFAGERPSLPSSDQIARLSELLRLAYAPRHLTHSEELFHAYKALARTDPHSQLLTPTELRVAVESLHALHKAEGVDGRLADFQISVLLEDIRSVYGQDKTALGWELRRLIWLHHADRERPSKWARNLEQNIIRKAPDEDSNDWVKLQYAYAVSHLLYVNAKRGDKRSFDKWWHHLFNEVDKRSLDGTRSAAWLARLILLRSEQEWDDVAICLRQAFGDVKRDEDRILLLNQAMFALIWAGKWDMVAPAYRNLVAKTSSTVGSMPSPLDATPKEDSIYNTLAVPKTLLPSRVTFSLVFAQICRTGHLYAAFTVLKHMIEANHAPNLPEYAALFNGFAKYGTISTDPPGQSRVAFGAWRYPSTTERMVSRLSVIWSRGRQVGGSSTGYDDDLDEDETSRPVSSAWSFDALKDVWAAFLALDTSGPRSPRLTGHQASGILVAFARMTNANDETLREVWIALEEKYGRYGGRRPEHGKPASWIDNARIQRYGRAIFGDEDMRFDTFDEGLDEEAADHEEEELRYEEWRASEGPAKEWGELEAEKNVQGEEAPHHPGQDEKFTGENERFFEGKERV
ncbi:hypothetical protein BCR39DRAFT_513835 [Naematelia encephala]|uniref:Tr-type G domain-containing protein n=1 Tax=Naematelia encephala TaxID=71784 RepID=A0A1Y2BIM7_9TREE|nr:hypothetical protein BCR39DRAFT_513835 [Naematelia encephala]